MLSTQQFLKRLAVLSAALCFASAGALRASVDTPTPSPTETSTPGSGSYAYTLVDSNLNPVVPPFFVAGNTGYELFITYTAATQFSGGVVAVQFPPDLDLTPVTTLGVPPAEAYEVNNEVYFGQGVSVTVNGLNQGDSLILEYGVGGPGFSVAPVPVSPGGESFQVLTNPLATLSGGGLVPAPAAIPVYSPTVSPTNTAIFTVSPTPTITQTITVSPTFTVSPTNTASPTNTPVGHIPTAALGFYSYPNPFDMRVYPQVTIRFPPTNDGVSISIFSLLGYPVRQIPSSAIQTSLGVAQWNGTDDYGRAVAGGLYFVRLKTSSGVFVHKMTVFD